MGFLTPNIEVDDTPVPEPGDATARRAAGEVRRRRARGGRAATILGNQSVQQQAQQTAPQPAATLFGGGRGRSALTDVN